ncbi:ABC transporter substrate-binding protein [Nitrobacteraceae bacterium UC4446_H13]
MQKLFLTFAAILTVYGYISNASAQMSGNVVRIGVLNDQSGPASDMTGRGTVIAAQLAIEDFGPSVDGTKIDLVFADHQNKADVGLGIARRWIDEDGVDAILDLGNSSVSLAVQNLAKERKIVVMHSSGSERIYGVDCIPTGFQWVYDTVSLARAIGLSNIGHRESWFILASDYEFGKSMRDQLKKVIEEQGGQVVGSVLHPLYQPDLSSFILQAQASKAKNVALANAGGDTTNAIKQAAEFGLLAGGQKLVATTFWINNVHSLGVPAAQGLRLSTAFYWDRTDGTRAFAKRFFDKAGKMPSQNQAAMYSATLTYLRAVQAAGTDTGSVVAAKIKALPVDDFYAEGARVRADGRLMNDQFLARVKSPTESKAPWDYYEIIDRVPAEKILPAEGTTGCRLPN